MKKLFPLLMLTLLFLVGTVSIGQQFEVSATSTLMVVVGGSLILSLSKQTFGVRDGLDVSAVASLLGDYIRINTAKIWVKVFQGLEFEAYMRKIGGQRGKFSTFKSSNTSVLQAFQGGFTAKGKVTFEPYINEVFRTKVDFLLDDIDEIYAGYLGFMADETIDRKDWPIVKYIVENHLIPSIVEELNIASARGVYVAPTIGIPGVSINICNGILTIVAAEITNTNIIPIATGVTNATNAFDNFETFADSVAVQNESMMAKGGLAIFCSKAMERFYKADYRATWGQTNDPMSKNKTALDHFDVKIIGLEAFGNSQRMLLTEKDNIIVGYDKIYTPNSFKVEEARREVAIMTDFHRGYGFGTLETVFANDQN